VGTLTLEHYPGMTESSISQIIDEAETRWPLLATTVIHRVGEMHPTDQIVLVVVASAHRSAAFAAAEFVMDYLKTRAVFWKKETSDQGVKWIESTLADRQRASTWMDPERALDALKK
jgi:molybdopterin synthase catalytic subunit